MTGLPLTGRRVLVGRAARQADVLAHRIAELGGEPVVAPLIAIDEGDRAAMSRAVRELAAGAYVAVCLTSPNGVDALADALAAEGLEAAVLESAGTVACVGPGTAAALEERLGRRADVMPATATTEALAEEFPPGSGRVLLARADRANPVLSRILRERGYEPDEVVAYRTVTAEQLDDTVVRDLAAGNIDLLAFGSSSTARGFHELIGGRPWRGRVVSIGPVTTRTCHELGIEVAVEARPHDLDGLVGALVAAAGRDP